MVHFTLSVIYILTPTTQSINYLEEDFAAEKNGKDFKLPPKKISEILDLLNANRQSQYEIASIVEASRSSVYSLNEPDFFKAFYNAYEDLDMSGYKKIAQKLVTLFCNLEEIPLIRYRRNFVKNLILAEAIQQEIELNKDSLKHIPESKINKSQL
ncbi:syntaxin-binding protein 1 [Caerostris extrusa]|uniref:Syntaxin-binding protein 1 n=1 Tax=Caerostris extrusa TaxID=172846 RepID=A0AAV4UNX3_CAEEX|nr:syntaxin-binding protein 1 [Caerostris extrusa]